MNEIYKNIIEFIEKGKDRHWFKGSVVPDINIIMDFAKFCLEKEDLQIIMPKEEFEKGLSSGTLTNLSGDNQ